MSKFLNLIISNWENLEESQLDMQNYLKTLLNFRKNSKAIHRGETLHYAPKDGVYLLSRKYDDEIVIYIVNKNDKSVSLDTDRFIEINANGKIFTDIYTDKKYTWSGEIQIKNNSSFILTNK